MIYTLYIDTCPIYINYFLSQIPQNNQSIIIYMTSLNINYYFYFIIFLVLFCIIFFKLDCFIFLNFLLHTYLIFTITDSSETYLIERGVMCQFSIIASVTSIVIYHYIHTVAELQKRTQLSIVGEADFCSPLVSHSTQIY